MSIRLCTRQPQHGNGIMTLANSYYNGSEISANVRRNRGPLWIPNPMNTATPWVKCCFSRTYRITRTLSLSLLLYMIIIITIETHTFYLLSRIINVSSRRRTSEWVYIRELLFDNHVRDALNDSLTDTATNHNMIMRGERCFYRSTTDVRVPQ